MEKLMGRLDDVILWLTETVKTEIPPFIEEAYRWWVIRDTIEATLCSVAALLAILLVVICRRGFRRELHKDYGVEEYYLIAIVIFGIASIASWMGVVQAHVAPKLYILSNLKPILG